MVNWTYFIYEIMFSFSLQSVTFVSFNLNIDKFFKRMCLAATIVVILNEMTFVATHVSAGTTFS